MDSESVNRPRRKPLHSPGKALYLMLCALLGALLFLILQRAVGLLYYVLLTTDFSTYSFGLSVTMLEAINYFTMIIAAAFGLWYGVWLGLHWYDMVYEYGQGGLFHAFRGQWLHHHNKLIIKPPQSPAPVRTVTVNPSPQPVRTIKPVLRQTRNQPKEAWDLDDLLKAESVTTVKVKARKTPARRQRSKKITPTVS